MVRFVAEKRIISALHAAVSTGTLCISKLSLQSPQHVMNAQIGMVLALPHQ